MDNAFEIVEMLLWESPQFSTLKKNKEPLDPEEREKVIAADAVWHMGNHDKPTSAVWKATVNGKTWFVTNTHRCFQARPTLAGAISAYHKVVKQTA